MTIISRRAILGGATLGAIGAAGLGLRWSNRELPGSQSVNLEAPVPSARKDLNVLILMVDQERAWSTLPDNLVLPNHERIAEKGTSFTNMNVTSPLCTPSRSVFWTGQHVQHTQVQDNTNVPFIGRPLNPAIPTLGHMLRDAGFYTAYKGKWHLHALPKDQNWENAPERINALEPYGFADYGWGPERIDSQDGWKYDGHIAEDASRWLTTTGKSLDKPWALIVSFVNPHDIMFFDATGAQAKTRTQNIFPGPVLPAPSDPLYQMVTHSGLPRNFRPSGYAGQTPGQADYNQYMNYFYGEMPFENQEAWINFSNYYYNCIHDVDRHIGATLNALEESGQADNTIVVLVSDHGEMGGVHGLRQKGPWMYRENLNVPFVISHPDLRTPRENTGIVSALDFTPTILGLVDVDAKAVKDRFTAMKGRDVSGDLTTGSTDRSRTGVGALVTYSVSHHADIEFARTNFENRIESSAFAKLGNMTKTGVVPDFSARSFMRGIVTDDFKFARYFSPADHHKPNSVEELRQRNDLELFDLEKDPGETTNLAMGQAFPTELTAGLNEKLNGLIESEVGIDDGRGMPGPHFLWRR